MATTIGCQQKTMAPQEYLHLKTYLTTRIQANTTIQALPLAFISLETEHGARHRQSASKRQVVESTTKSMLEITPQQIYSSQVEQVSTQAFSVTWLYPGSDQQSTTSHHPPLMAALELEARSRSLQASLHPSMSIRQVELLRWSSKLEAQTAPLVTPQGQDQAP